MNYGGEEDVNIYGRKKENIRIRFKT